MENGEVLTRDAKVWLGEDGIARNIYFPNAEDTLADAKENLAGILKVNRGKRYPLLVDMRKLKSMTREARVYYAGGEGAKTANAGAFLIGSLISKIIGNFFLSFNKPLIPIKLFTSESEAIEWLKGFIQ